MDVFISWLRNGTGLVLLSCCFMQLVGAQPREAMKVDGRLLQPVTEPAEMGAWLRRLVGKYRFEGMVQVVFEMGSANPPYPCVTDAGMPTDYCQGIKGKGDCVAVGDGPGVQCMLNVHWMDIYEVRFQQSDPDAQKVDASPTGVFEIPGGVSSLNPAMSLHGLDPAHAGIEYLLVDQKGLPEGGLGFIKGNTATFRTRCVNEATLLNAMKPRKPSEDNPGASPWVKCERIVSIDARPDASIVHVTVDIEINEEPFTRQQMTLRREVPVESQAGASSR
jgi:hypothetical protein